MADEARDRQQRGPKGASDEARQADRSIATHVRVNPLVGLSVARYVLAIGIFVGVVVFGLIETNNLGVDLLPTTNIPVVMIGTSYPGASPAVVDQQVTQVVESAVSTVGGITSISSDSGTGSSRVILQFGPDTNQAAIANAVAAQVASLRGLPSGAGTPIVRTFDPNAQPILEMGLTAPGANMNDVYAYATNILVPAMQLVQGVANVNVTGGSQLEYQVLLDPAKLAYYNLSPSQVSSAISSSIVNQPIGSITRQNNVLTFATNSQPTNVADIAGMVVDSSRNIRVQDLGRVQTASIASNYTRVNGQPAVLLSVQQAAGSNAVAVANGVRSYLASTTLPTGYHVTISNDTTGPIVASVHSTFHELWVTAIVVAIIVLLFLGRLNTAFTVILAIPIALSAAPVLYGLLGFTFNEVSLLALIVAIGIVVDDSIVVAENVERYRAMGMDRRTAVLRGASQVFGAVTAASLSLLAVLIPVSFMGGFAGNYLRQFGLGLAAAVFLSWLEALLFLTVRMAYIGDAAPQTWRDAGRHLRSFGAAVRWGWRNWRRPWGLIVLLGAAYAVWRFLPHIDLVALLAYPIAWMVIAYVVRAGFALLEALTGTLHGWTEAGLTWVRDSYTALLARMLPFSAWVLVGAAAFLALTLFVVGPRVTLNFVPQTDSGLMQVGARLPSGTTLAQANVVAGKVEDFLMAQSTVRTVQTSVSSNDINVQAQLIPVTQRPSIFTLGAEYQRSLQQAVSTIPDARVFVRTGGGFRGQGSGVSFDLLSTDYALLSQRLQEIPGVLANDPNVLSVDTGNQQASPEFDFVPNPNLLAGTGITASTVAQVLRSYTGGSTAGTVQTGGESDNIVVRLDPGYLQDAQSLLSLPIYSPTLKTNLQVSQLGSIVEKQAPLRISRSNRLYSAGFTLTPSSTAPSPIEFQQQVARALTQAGVLDSKVTMGAGDRFGRAGLSRQLGTLGPRVFALAVLLAYLVMGAQFNSFRYPIYLLLPVPLAVAGAIWFLVVQGQALDIFSLMGMLLLIGLSAKNAILYLEFVVERIGKMPFKEAMVESARLRFRPIVMTTLTVLVISFPLLFGRGAGSEFNHGIALVMLGGIVVSALLTFFVVPAAFYLFERGREEARQVVPAAVGVEGSETDRVRSAEPWSGHDAAG
jgi:HAE1 family hydrophobic/amphiphilic exporter-1